MGAGRSRHGIGKSEMGMHNVVDPVTGLSIRSGEEIVAIMIQRRVGGYPDAVKAIAKTPLGPTDMFEPASLPVFGRMGSYGDVVPHGEQLSAALFQEMASAKTWETAFERATDFNDGLSYPIRRIDAAFGQTEPTKEVLGVAILHRTTWDKVVEMRWSPTGKTEDVEAFLAIDGDLTRRLDAGDDRDRARFEQILLRGLNRGPSDHAMLDGSKVRVPRLAGVLGIDEGGRPLSHDFGRWLTDHGLMDIDAAPDRRVLEGLWDLVAFQQGLDMLGRMVLPSKSHGQNTNALQAIEGAMLAIDNAAGQIHAMADDDHELRDTEVERLQAQIDRLDDLKSKLEDALRTSAPRP